MFGSILGKFVGRKTAHQRRQDQILQQFVKNNSTKVGEFGSIYPELLSNITGDKVAILEIGQRRGETFRTLLDVMPTATVYGIDIGRGEYKQLKIKEALERYSPRARPHVGDQTDAELLNRIGSEALREFGGFDLVIDDGGHSMDQQQTSLRILAPYLKPRGIYVIEDIDTSYYEQCGGGALGKAGTTIDLIKGLIDVINRDFVDGHYKTLNRPRRCVGDYSLFAGDHRINSVRIFPACAVIYFGYDENLPAQFQKPSARAA
jgi:hypothetical protein